MESKCILIKSVIEAKPEPEIYEQEEFSSPPSFDAPAYRNRKAQFSRCLIEYAAPAIRNFVQDNIWFGNRFDDDQRKIVFGPISRNFNDYDRICLDNPALRKASSSRSGGRIETGAGGGGVVLGGSYACGTHREGSDLMWPFTIERQMPFPIPRSSSDRRRLFYMLAGEPVVTRFLWMGTLGKWWRLD